MSLAFSSIRVGKKYILTNFGEVSEFEVIANLGRVDFKLKDLHTLEPYSLSDLIKFGKGTDFSLWELR
jgi:hypothetical protein